MSRDPYHDFASDLRSSLGAAQGLSQAYVARVRGGSSAGASVPAEYSTLPLETLQDRLQDALEALRQDVADVRGSVDVVEKAGPERFGVDAGELGRRKKFVSECERQVLELERLSRPPASGKGSASAAALDLERGQVDEDADEQVAFEREHQQALVARQDTTLETIGSTLSSLRTQAGVLGQEIGEQVELLGTFDQEVDASQNRLQRAMGRMDEMVRRGDDKLGGWCVWILIVALMFLLLIVFLV